MTLDFILYEVQYRYGLLPSHNGQVVPPKTNVRESLRIVSFSDLMQAEMAYYVFSHQLHGYFAHYR